MIIALFVNGRPVVEREIPSQIFQQSSQLLKQSPLYMSIDQYEWMLNSSSISMFAVRSTVFSCGIHSAGHKTISLVTRLVCLAHVLTGSFDHTVFFVWLQSFSRFACVGFNTTQKWLRNCALLILLLFYCCSNQLSNFYCTVIKCFSFAKFFFPQRQAWWNSHSVGSCLLQLVICAYKLIYECILAKLDLLIP